MQAAHLISWQLIKFFVHVSLCQNKVLTTLNHCLIIVAAENQGWSLSSYFGNNIFFLSLISTKITSRKILILFNWSFLWKMWNKIFNIVICCLPPLYLATKAICPLWEKQKARQTQIVGRMGMSSTRNEPRGEGQGEAMTASLLMMEDVWFESLSVPMDKTSSLTSGSTSHMFGKRHCESGGVWIGKPHLVVKIRMQGEKRWDVVWAHVGPGTTASGQMPWISSIIKIGYDDRC